MKTGLRTAIAPTVLVLVAAACGDSAPTPTVTAAPTTTTLAAGQRGPLGVAKVPTTTTSTTTTAAPATTTTTTTDAVVQVGTVDNPVALGSSRLVGDWVITVKSVDTNAEAAVLNENPFNDPAGDGDRFVLAEIEASYVGGDTGWPWIEIDHWMLGGDGVLYKGIATECGVVPNDLSFIGEVFPGGTVTGNLCHRVAVADANVATLVVEKAFGFGDSDAAVFALHEGVGSVPLDPPPALPVAISGGPLGSIGNPIELKSPGIVGEWRVSVDSVDFDATATILAQNQFNDPPDSGYSYVLVTLEATYEGSETGDPWFDIRGKVLGAARIAHEGFESYCGVIPNDFTAVGDVQAGTTVVANMCWSVPTDDTDSLILILEDYQTYDGGRLFYALG